MFLHVFTCFYLKFRISKIKSTSDSESEYGICRSRQELSNGYLVAKISVDTASLRTSWKTKIRAPKYRESDNTPTRRRKGNGTWQALALLVYRSQDANHDYFAQKNSETNTWTSFSGSADLARTAPRRKWPPRPEASAAAEPLAPDPFRASAAVLAGRGRSPSASRTPSLWLRPHMSTRFQHISNTGFGNLF